MRKILIIILFVIITLSYGDQKYKIKFATLATRGSTWLNVMTELNNAIKQATSNNVRFKIYPGGVSGEELDVLRKIRAGQLDAGGFTGVALGEIVSEVRIFDSPFLFKNYEEVDYIHELLFDEFSKKFEQNGFILLGWTEVGFVYIFTKKKIEKIDDLKGVKMWMWEGDKVAEATFNALGFKPIPLAVTDVITALQTGMIEGLYTSPLGAIALQWNTQVKYMLKIPLANAIGAIVVSKNKWDKLPQEYQDTIRTLSKQYMKKLTKLSRKDNQKSIEILKQNGIIVTELKDKTELDKLNKAGIKARMDMAVKYGLFPVQLLNKVEKSLSDFRNEHNK